MVLDTKALDAIAEGRAGRMKVPLPDGTAVDLVFHRVRDRGGMTRTLEGEVEGEPQKTVAQFVYHDGIVHGSVARYDIDRHYEYRILSSGFLMVTELDLESMTDNCGGSPPPPAADIVHAAEGPDGEESAGEEDGDGSVSSPDTSGYVTMDIVVGYDAGARVADGGVSQIEARIISSVDRMNLAFTNSAITQTEIMLLGVIEDPNYVFPGGTSGDMGSADELGNLNNTTGSNPALNAVSDYATALGADLRAFVVRDADGSAGIAYKPGTSSVTARTYMTSTRITFAHEVGHNIGSGHSWGDSSGDSSKTVHNYGWRLAPAGQTRVRTIMAYDWAWGNGSRIPYFANPAVTYQGARTGQINGYNATGDVLSDSRYVSGGLEGSHGAGFDGTNPSLGARNGPYILAQAPGRANQRTRTNFQIVDPAAGVTWTSGETRQIYWTGGDYEDSVSISLYKGGVLQATIASGLSGEQRKYSWVLPAGLANGNDYMIRVTRNGTLSADSGIFSLSGGTGSQTITFAPITNKITTDTFTLSATGGGSGNPVTFAVTSGPAVIGSGNLVSFTGAGSVTITASQAGNANYLPAEDVSRTFNVTKATATLSLAPLSQTYNGSARTVSATTNPPSLPVTITYNGSATPPVNAGSYTVIGNINHSLYQGTMSGTLVVAKATATVTLSALNQVYDGGPKPVTVTTSPVGLSYSLTYNGIASAPFNAGSYAVEVIINAPNHQGSGSGTLNVSQAPQTISFPSLGNAVTTDTVTLAATGGASGNPVTYAVTEGPGQITGGNQLTFTGAGLVRVVASQGGNTNFLAAVPVERSLTVSKATAQILLTGLNPVYNGSPQGTGIATVPAGLGYTATYNGSTTLPTEAGTYPLSVTINDLLYQGTASDDFVIQKAMGEVTLTGLGKVYTGSPQGAGATTVPAGVPVVFTYDGLPVHPENAGTYAVVATIDHPSVEGSATGTFVIGKASQPIGFAPILDQFATNTVHLTATGGGSNNPVVFEVVEGTATLSGGNVLTFSAEGTVSVRASQAGDANHLDADTVTRSFNVTKFPATVTLLNLTQGYDGTPRPVAYTTSPAGLNVTLTYDGSPEPPVVPRSYFVLAVVDEPFYQGDIGGYLTITKGVQTIDFPAIPPQSATAAVTLAATGGPSGNPVIYEIESGPGAIEGNELTFTASGTVVVRATQAGDDLYAAATPVSRSVTVTKAPATVDLSGLSQTYDGQPRVPMATTTPPGLSVAFTYDGLPDAPVAAGSYAVVASISDPRYEGGDSDTLVVAKAAQVIGFAPLADALANASVPLSASGGGSGNPVIFAVTAGPASLQGGNTLVFSGAGEVGVTASQAGDANHLAAAPVERTFTVSKAPAPGLTLSALRQVFDGSPREVVVTTQPAGLASLVTYEGDPDAPTGTGTYAVVATLDDPIYEGSATGTLVVDDPARLDLVPGGSLPALSALGAIEVTTFSLGRYEVTWGLWKQVRDWAVQNGYDLAAVGAGCEDDHPVRGVNWFEAVKWCNARTEWENATLGTAIEPSYRLGGSVYRTGQPATADEVEVRAGTSGYRLPTPGEREFAARGGRLSAGHPYPGGVNAGELAWHAANSAGAACDLSGGRGTRAAGGLLPNELGLHDLAGNVSEWTGGSLTSTPAQRLVGGGDWDAPAASLLHTALADAAPGERSDRVGFRVARSVVAALATALDNEQLPWESGGDTAWYAQTADHTDGIDGAAIGALGGEDAAWVETTVTGPGNVAFSWKIQIPAGTGSLRVTLDGEPRGVISGASDWAAGSVYLPPGIHQVRWTYERSQPPQGTSPDPVAGPNGAWLDAVVFTEAVVPTVITGTVGELGETSGSVGGTVSSDGGAAVETRGIVVSTGTEPVLGQDPDFAAPSAGTGGFAGALTGLAPGTTYRARAYASNAAGTGYGATILFTTDETIDLSGGTATRDRTIEAGDRQVFHFSLSGPRHALFTATGGAALRAALYDGSGGLLASFDGDGDFSLGDLLYAGSYELHVHRTAGAGAAQDYTLAFDASTVAETLPDVGVGASALVQTGVGVRGDGAGQVLSLGSRKAVAVRGVATFRNGGTLPDELILFGSGGSALFAVAYLGEGGNVTAQMLAGTLRTPVLEEGDEAVAVQVSVVPNRKKLSEKKGKRTVTLKKTHVLSIRAVSDFDPAITDQAAVVVRTY